MRSCILHSAKLSLKKKGKELQESRASQAAHFAHFSPGSLHSAAKTSQLRRRSLNTTTVAALFPKPTGLARCTAYALCTLHQERGNLKTGGPQWVLKCGMCDGTFGKRALLSIANEQKRCSKTLASLKPRRIELLIEVTHHFITYNHLNPLNSVRPRAVVFPFLLYTVHPMHPSACA